MRNAADEHKEGSRARRVGEFLEALEGVLPTAGLEGGRVTSLRIRLPTEAEPSTLLVVKASTEGGDFITFIGGYQVTDVILAWRARCTGGVMKWREDVPWEQRG